MLDAQEVRKRRQDKIAEILNTELKEVFDWILTLIDHDTKKGNLKPLNLILYHDDNNIRKRFVDHSENDNEINYEYDLSIAIKNFGKIKFMNELKEFIGNEEGFSLIYNYDENEDLPAAIIKTIDFYVYVD